MKLVRENINEKFEEKSDPIKDMGIGKKQMFEDLIRRGMTMWFDWGDDGPQQRELAIEHIHEITGVVNKLVEAGFDIKKMSMSFAANIKFLYIAANIKVEVVNVLRSNHVIADCATEEDAKILIDVIKKFSLWEHDIFGISKGEHMISIYPSQHQWLDNLIENRKKYKKLIG